MDQPYLARSGKETPRTENALSRYNFGHARKTWIWEGKRRAAVSGEGLGKETIESLSFSSPVLLSFLALPLLARGYIRDVVPDSINYGTVVALKIYEQGIYIFVFSVRFQILFPRYFSSMHRSSRARLRISRKRRREGGKDFSRAFTRRKFQISRARK